MEKNEVLKLNQLEFLQKIKSSVLGLSEEEAGKRLIGCGLNVVGKKNVNAIKVFTHQFQNSFVYLLIIASLISYWVKDYTGGTVILIILLINTILGFYQEYKSEKIVEKLSKFITNQVRVKRGGQNFLIEESKIVPGDIVTIKEGDIIPADIRLLTVEDLQVNESQLTGESALVSKKVSKESVATVNDLLFTGSIIEKGEGIGVVYATAKNTELGIIARLSTETKKQTKYEESMQSFSMFLMKITLVGLSIVFIAKLILRGGFSDITNLLLFVIAVAIAVVPEVFPVIATVTLTNGAMKLAKKHVVVRRLSSLEDLGNVNLLCTDKTGTITENKMVINKIVSSNNELFQKFAYAAITPLKIKKRRNPNSYDDAFLNYVPENIVQEAKDLIILKELSFDPDAKRRRVVLFDNKNNLHYLIVIGAPEVILDITHKDKKDEYLHVIQEEGSEGLHHIALSFKSISYTEDFDILKNEDNLIFLGYVSFKDPLRSTVKDTIIHAKELGINVKILTGDSREVSQYIGKQIGLAEEGKIVYLGDELDKMSPEEFKNAVINSNIFARVSPTQKYNIIKILKEKYIVAYQGDGINDAPALKMADVAIAVNTATDIAKENADIVLLNESLEVIINGIKYGRSIFININKYIKYTMVSNFGKFIALSILYLTSVNLPMLPIQILLTSLITDIPMIAISSDTVENEEIVAPEKHNTKGLILISLILGIPTAFFYLLYFFIVHAQSQKLLSTNLYVFFTFIALIVFYSIRTKRSFWRTRPPSTLLNISFGLAFIFSSAMVYIGIFQNWFSFVSLSKITIILMLLLTVLYFFTIDIIKVMYYKYN